MNTDLVVKRRLDKIEAQVRQLRFWLLVVLTVVIYLLVHLHGDIEAIGEMLGVSW